MCGIAGFVGELALKRVLRALLLMEYRGYDSVGVGVKLDLEGSGSGFKVLKTLGAPSEHINIDKLAFNGEQLGEEGKVKLAIGHTRWATHGGVSEKNAHPFIQGHVMLVHNGVTKNFLQLKEKLLDKDRIFTSETDSEVLAALIDEAAGNIASGEKKDEGSEEGRSKRRLKAIKEALEEVKGDYALVFMFDDEGKLYFAVKGQPLLLSKELRGLASDPAAFAGEKASYAPLPSGTIGWLSEDKVEFLGAPKLTFISAPSLEEVGKGRFPYFMRKEIEEQATLFKRALDANIKAAKELIEAAPAIFIVAAGTSYNAARLLQHLLYKKTFEEEHWKPIILKYGHEFYPKEWKHIDKALVVALSQSGETLDVISPLEETNAPILAIVNRLGSTLARLASVVVPIGAESEIGVAATKSFLNQLILSYRLAGHELDGEQIQKAVKGALSLEEHAANLSEKIVNAAKRSGHIFVLGKAEMKYIAAELKLKMQEVAYLSMEFLPTGELKHGPLAAVSEGTVVVVLVPEGEKGRDALGEAVKALGRGAYVFLAYPSSLEEDVADLKKNYGQRLEVVRFSDTMPYLLFSYTVFAQLLAYHAALHLGKNPDKPRNLAKSVTVR